jgi:L-fucose isomerase-like protein
MNVMNRKTTFGLIVGTRNIFSARLANTARKQLLARLDKLGIQYVIPAESETTSGAIETLADAKKCADLFKKNRDAIDGVVVVLPNFGDELGVVNTLQLAGLNVPVLVQACNDEVDKVGLDQRRDAFCGKLSVCNNLYQYGIPFTDTTSHTCDIESDEFDGDLKRFALVCRTVKGLRNARFGAIGARPGAFQTVRFSEKLLQASGITVVPVDLSEMIAAATKLGDGDKPVKDMLARIKTYGKIPGTIRPESIAKQAKLSVAINNWMAENECDASAIQCWTSIQNNYGCATCLSMSMMGEDLRPSACEMDISGAVSMYALLLSSGQIPGFLDWNNNYKYDSEKCVCTHCSNYPKSFMGADIEISDLDILGETIGRPMCFGAIKGHVAPGEMTYFRISTDDTKGKIKGYLGQGQFTSDPFPMHGGIAVCQVKGLRKLLAHLCQEGFEHHVAMTRSHCADVLGEAVTKYLKWDIYRHE